MRDLGECGNKETENEVLLLEYDIPHQTFSQNVLNDLPKLPWIITEQVNEHLEPNTLHVVSTTIFSILWLSQRFLSLVKLVLRIFSKFRKFFYIELMFDHFVGLTLKGLSELINFYSPEIIKKPKVGIIVN